MPSQVLSSIENNFTKGLITEFTGLNFPENAATDCDNVAFTIVGDVTRRSGIDMETDFVATNIEFRDRAQNSYVWNNAGGDGSTKLLVRQIGSLLYFYAINSATVATPVSSTILASTVNLSSFVALGGSLSSTSECQFSDGNGYLFVYNSQCDPFYCTFSAGVVAGNSITIKTRDFQGVPEAGVPDNSRPTSLTSEHNYNLINQGWIAGNPWQANSSTPVLMGLGSKTFTVQAGLSAVPGDQVTIIANHPTIGLPVTGPMMSGNVTAYAGTTLTVNVTSGSTGWFGSTGDDWLIVPRNTAYITDFFSAVGSYPSNADVWWYFKNASGVFDPATTADNVTLALGKAPRGHFVLEAFNQQRDVLSGVTAITDIITTSRPKTGTWFQGRVWYTGVDAQQVATGDANYYTWTENIYFSQIINDTSQFGNCYQINDPTSEVLFDLLPTDGGVIQIQGCGSVYKLFPFNNGLLVFAANGIWFITGSQGIGFTANDYTINKISSIQNISSTSFVNASGLPYFWNEEGIYVVQPAQGGGMTVEPITIGTILSFYEEIPFASKKYVRGDYNPIDYVIQWVYRSEIETSGGERYRFNRILNYNVYNKAFYPYTISASVDTGAATEAHVNGINYVSYPTISGSTPDPSFKYISSYLFNGVPETAIADEHFDTYMDWNSFGGSDYSSYFVTGYKLHGQGQRRFQLPYIYVFSRNEEPTSYKIQGLWDYAITGNSGRWSVAQLINNWSPNFGMIFRRHKIRGRGLVLQIKITSVDGQPFDIMGWSSMETQNTGV